MEYLGYPLNSRVFLAPMAGVTDRPFRMLCRKLGAGLTPSEMISSEALVRDKPKTLRRMDHQGESSPRVVQIAGADAEHMAEAARINVERGAEIIDINMGCPAKKVCNTLAGSALLRDEPLVAKILTAVVKAVPHIPVSLKIRTGWDRNNKNAVKVARMAEDCGVRALAIHGRTRSDMYHGEAEYDTIAEVKSHIKIPLIANGDIATGEKALKVLKHTAADAVMIGRAAQGNPWLFSEIHHVLQGLIPPAPPSSSVLHEVIHKHTLALYEFYGEEVGVRVARKHLSWYIRDFPGSAVFRRHICTVESCAEQLSALKEFFDAHAEPSAILEQAA